MIPVLLVAQTFSTIRVNADKSDSWWFAGTGRDIFYRAVLHAIHCDNRLHSTLFKSVDAQGIFNLSDPRLKLFWGRPGVLRLSRESLAWNIMLYHTPIFLCAAVVGRVA